MVCSLTRLLFRSSMQCERPEEACRGHRGDASLLLMDDPATGLDVFAKRTAYKTAQQLRRLNKSAVLLVTTGLCDAVVMSDRLSIMVDGRLRCVGTLDELRAHYCRGFVIRTKVISKCLLMKKRNKK